MEAGSSDGDFHEFPCNGGICGPRLDFLWISSILGEFSLICVDFMDSWGIWCPWLDDGKRWYSDGRFSDVL